MKKISVLLSLLLIASLFLAGCSGTNQMTVTLGGNPTTGYAWTYTVSDPDVLKEVSNEYKQDADTEGLTGAGGEYVFVFEGGNEGEADLVFSYLRDWEEEEPIATIAYHVVVDNNKNIIDQQETSSTGDVEASVVVK